jgi:hypothetical protein
MAKLHVYQPNLPKGVETEVFPFGIFKNWGTYDVEALDEDKTIGDPKAPEPVALEDMEFEVVLPGPPATQDPDAESVAVEESSAPAPKPKAGPVRSESTAAVEPAKKEDK